MAVVAVWELVGTALSYSISARARPQIESMHGSQVESMPFNLACRTSHVALPQHTTTHLASAPPLQELLDCLDLLLAVEKVEDVRAHLGPILARKQAGLLASLTQVNGASARQAACLR